MNLDFPPKDHVRDALAYSVGSVFPIVGFAAPQLFTEMSRAEVDDRWRDAETLTAHWWDEFHWVLCPNGKHPTGDGYRGLIQLRDKLAEKSKSAWSLFDDGNAPHPDFEPSVTINNNRASFDAWLLLARENTVSYFIDLYEDYGVFGKWKIINRLYGEYSKRYNSTSSSDAEISPFHRRVRSSRLISYLRGVLSLRSSPPGTFSSIADYLGAIADGAPRPGGEAVTAVSVGRMFTRYGLAPKNVSVEEYRSHVEKEATRTLGLRPSGDGQVGAAPELGNKNIG